MVLVPLPGRRTIDRCRPSTALRSSLLLRIPNFLKIALVAILLTIVCSFGLAFAFRPQVATFAQTEEIRGRIAYSGRFANARLSLRSVFSGASALGGTHGGFSEVPNGTEMVAQVAQVRTLLGSVRVIVKATSVVDGRTLIERTPAQCMEDWDKATLSILIVVIANLVLIGLGVRWLFNDQTTTQLPRRQDA